jgi:CRISPR type I-E-associated protein CasB/Cse2
MTTDLAVPHLTDALDLIRHDRGTAAACRRGVNTSAAMTWPAMWHATAAAFGDHLDHVADGDPRLDAVHHALALYAWHQHGIADRMHRPGRSLGLACRTLSHAVGHGHVIEQRFHQALTVHDLDGLADRLLRLVKGLHDQAIPLDYDDLVTRLAGWHHEVERQQTVRAWGIDYFREIRSGTEETP